MICNEKHSLQIFKKFIQADTEMIIKYSKTFILCIFFVGVYISINFTNLYK